MPKNVLAKNWFSNQLSFWLWLSRGNRKWIEDDKYKRRKRLRTWFSLTCNQYFNIILHNSNSSKHLQGMSLPGAERSALHAQFSFHPHYKPRGRYWVHLHFTDKETEAGTGWLIFPTPTARATSYYKIQYLKSLLLAHARGWFAKTFHI